MRALATVAGIVAMAAACEGAAPSLTPYRLGKAEAAPELMKQAGSEVTRTASGRDATQGRDEGTFAAVQTDELNFTFSARVAKAEASETSIE